MKTPLILLAIALFCAALGSAQPIDDMSPWHADWPTAQRIAKKLNKPIFAVFVCRH